MSNTPLYTELSAAAQAAFAGLDLVAKQLDLERSIADLPGGFSRKTVAGRLYWYYQVQSVRGVPSQFYIGPDDAQTQSLIAAHQDPERASARQQVLALTRGAIEYGCASIIAKHAKVLDRLADHGFFRAGGILAGTHVFVAYQNVLGVRWQSGAMTLDLDFAHPGKNVSIALPSSLKIDTHKAIESLQMGFIPVQSQTTYKKADEPDFDLDFLTSRGRSGDKPVHIDALNVTLQPLRFMEFSMEDPMRLVLLARSGPIVVNAPRPERYAVHKLLVHGERSPEMRTKANKDLAQAASLIEYLSAHDPEALASAWHNLCQRGKGWSSRAQLGLLALQKNFAQVSLDIFRR